MKKILLLTLMLSTSAFAIGPTDNFRAPGGLIVNVGDTQSELFSKMSSRPSPTDVYLKTKRGKSYVAQEYTYNIDSMIYKVTVHEGRIIQITSDYS